MNGIANVYKLAGISSSKAVSVVRRALGERRVGHMGTLDPMGEGVLLMGVGKCTRLFDRFLTKTKTYEASFKFGYETDTLDSTGKITAETSEIPTMSDIIGGLSSFLGSQEQYPPAYSAKSVGGVRSYALARKGIIAELAPSVVTINELRLVRETGENEYMFEVDCSSGTYIRSLCRDIAHSLGSLATMTYIKRTRCGNFFADDAILPENMTPSDVIPAERVLSELPRVDAPSALYRKISDGVPVRIEGAPSGEFALYCDGELFGIAADETGGVKICVYLKEDGNSK